MLSAFHFVFLRDSECQVIFPFSGQFDGTETLVLPIWMLEYAGLDSALVHSLII